MVNAAQLAAVQLNNIKIVSAQGIKKKKKGGRKLSLATLLSDAFRGLGDHLHEIFSQQLDIENNSKSTLVFSSI